MIVAMPKILTEKLGSDGADALIHILNDVKEETRKDLVTKADLAETKAELLKWMFIFWVGQVGATLAILFVFFKQ